MRVVGGRAGLGGEGEGGGDFLPKFHDISFVHISHIAQGFLYAYHMKFLLA